MLTQTGMDDGLRVFLWISGRYTGGPREQKIPPPPKKMLWNPLFLPKKNNNSHTSNLCSFTTNDSNTSSGTGFCSGLWVSCSGWFRTQSSHFGSSAQFWSVVLCQPSLCNRSLVTYRHSFKLAPFLEWISRFSPAVVPPVSEDVLGGGGGGEVEQSWWWHCWDMAEKIQTYTYFLGNCNTKTNNASEIWLQWTSVITYFRL